jgi:hypothetical protein
VDDELRRILMFARQQHEEIACCGIPDNPSPAGVGSHLDSRIVLQLKAVARQLFYSVEHLGDTPVPVEGEGSMGHQDRPALMNTPQEVIANARQGVIVVASDQPISQRPGVFGELLESLFVVIIHRYRPRRRVGAVDVVESIPSKGHSEPGPVRMGLRWIKFVPIVAANSASSPALGRRPVKCDALTTSIFVHGTSKARLKGHCHCSSITLNAARVTRRNCRQSCASITLCRRREMRGLDLAGRTAIVTGGSRGIGQAAAAELAAAGANVVITSRTQDAADQAAAEIGRGVAGFDPHATDEATAARCVDFAVERFGSLDILGNNAGTNPAFGPVLDQDRGQFLKTLRRELVGAGINKEMLVTGFRLTTLRWNLLGGSSCSQDHHPQRPGLWFQVSS